MKFRLFLIAAIAVIAVQSAQAARFRIVNETNEDYVVGINSKKNVGDYYVDAGETSDTIDTGLHTVQGILWVRSDNQSKGWFANLNIPTAVLAGRFKILDTKGNYEYDFGIGRKGKGKAAFVPLD